jgi:hypothetical protein
MGKTVTDIIVILDRSGSMEWNRDATIKGFNSFVQEQKNVVGKARLTLVQFDAPGGFRSETGKRPGIETMYAKVPLEDVLPLTFATYQPFGNTPLYDAIGHTLDSSLVVNGKVVCLIITDGMENASTSYTLPQIKNMIQVRQAKGWQFVFIGADVRSMAVAEGMGVLRGSTGIYTSSPMGTQSMYATMSSSVGATRGSSIGKITLDSVNIPDVIPEKETVKAK